MKKALLKDSVKEIKNTYKRFISILLMAFLGVGFFAGLRATSPDMVDTIDNYYDEQNVYDIQILSTLGLTDEDIEAISQIENVETVYGSFEQDGKIEIGSSEIVAKVITLGELNEPVLLSGNMPQNENECLVEETFLSNNDKQIGDTVLLEIEDTTNDDGEEVEYLKQKEMTIVGTVQSPLYISRDRGTSSLGAGKIDYYIYIPKENINATDVYTNIYIQVKDAKEYTTSSTEYEEYIEEVKDDIEAIKEEREQARHDTLVGKAQEKVDEAEEELNTQKADGQKQIDEAEQKLNDAKKEVEEGESEISSQKKKADTEFANAEKEIASAKTKISNSEKELKEKETEANAQFEELENQKEELQTNLSEVNSGLEQLQTSYNSILELLKNENLTEEQKQTYGAQKTALETQINSLKENKKTIEAGITQIEEGITSGKQEIENAKAQIEDAKTELATKEKQYNNTKKSTYNQIDQAEQEIEDAKKEIEDGEKELEEQKQEFEEKIADAESELSDAKEKILEIESPTWYILDRNANAGYVSFIQDTESIDNIATVFPIVFFIVAALISLTSMTRMVEEQRMQIGTLKALGYNKFQIMQKYIIYASLACIIGGILGMGVGFVLLPKVIWMMYELMYQITDISISFNLTYGGIGLILICVCIIGATIYAVLRELRETPATLMRPKAPKMGSRVLLEKIPFIWNRLNFTRKVTVRNIFRYKKRFYMTVIGILGCTALILTGFGIKDSVTSIIPDQFEKIFTYDMQVTLKDSLTEEEKDEFAQKLEQNEKIEKASKVYMTSGSAINNENSEDIQIIVPYNESSLDGMINIIDLKTGQNISLNGDEICLTDKAAELLNVSVGDTITLRDNDEKEVQVKISNIIENYVNHYVFMSRETYETVFNEDYKTNVILTKNVELSDEEEDALASEIMSQSEVASITDITTFAQSIIDAMSLLDYVVLVLIVAAGLLAFVVLYNLANVNISERIRELATIKVLGFYDREVYDYVTRETVILTVIGIILGLIAGYFLNYYIMGTCEINILRFSKVIKWQSYVYAALITIVFTVIVNIATYFTLKKIDMVESLKSVE